LALAIATTFLAPKVIDLLYSSQYSASADPLVILMWSQAFLFLIFFFSNVLTSVSRQRILSYAAAAMLLTNATLNWLLIPKFGIQGAALAKLLASICGFAVLFIAVNKIFALDLRQFFLRAAMLGFVFAGGVILLSPIQLGISIVASSGIFLMLVIMSGVFNHDEMAILKSLIPNSVSRK
jgi:O-antigen/teichoic acid export membrane protein